MNPYPMLFEKDEKRFPYPIELILTGVHVLFNLNSPKRVSKCPKRSLLLYNLAVINEHYLPLNREYKPLGLSFYDDWARYESYPFLMIPKANANVKFLEELNTLGHHFFFFTDITYPDKKNFKLRYTKLLENVFGDHYLGFSRRIRDILDIHKGY